MVIRQPKVEGEAVMKKMSPFKRTRNILAQAVDPILALIALMSVATLVSPPVGLAQVNPSWISTGSLNIPRNGATATLLANGKVLVVGGNGGGNSAELRSEEHTSELQSR